MTGDAATRAPGATSPNLSRDDFAAIFACAPTSLWIQDLAALKRRLDEWRAAGVEDLRAWLDADAARVEELVALVRVVAVNDETLRMYEVADEAELFQNIRLIFGDDQITSFVDVICQLWEGAVRTSVVTSNYTSKGRPFDVSYNGRLLPGHETDWSRYLISVEDVSARENAYRQLEAARLRDPLTGLFNRVFLNEEMGRLEGSSEALAFAVIDLNGLKAANDRFGHKAGDELLRRMGRVLSDSLPSSCRAMRMGGDEFVIVMRGLGKTESLELIEALSQRVEAQNAAGPDAPLTFSIGMAWRMPGESTEALLARADRDMYASKRAFYGRAA